jgi:hypothetical protein
VICRRRETWIFWSGRKVGEEDLLAIQDEMEKFKAQFSCTLQQTEIVRQSGLNHPARLSFGRP